MLCIGLATPNIKNLLLAMEAIAEMPIILRAILPSMYIM